MRTVSGLAKGGLVVILIAVGGAALRLLMDRQSMATMIDDYGQTLTSMPVPPGPASQAFASARERAGSGDYAGAKADLKRGVGLVSEAAVPAAPTGPPSPETPSRAPSPEELDQAAEGLPEKVRPFFRDHPDLLRQVMMLRTRAEGRVPPAEMEKYAERIMEAAAAGDEEKLKSILGEIRRALGPPGAQGGRRPGGRTPGGGRMPGGGPRGAGEARGQVQQWIAEARRILAQAKGAGADTSKAASLVNRAEQLLAQGKEKEAAEKMEEVMRELRGLAGRAQRRPRGAPRTGPRMARRPPGDAAAGAMPGVMGALLGQMRSESAAIVGAMEDIQNAGLALLEKNHDQIREILSSATDKLKAVGRGRAELNEKLQEMQQEARRSPQGQRPGQVSPGQQRRQQRPGQAGPPFARAPQLDAERVHDLLGRALDEARTLSPEDFEKQREDMIERIVVSLLRPPDEPITLKPDEPLRPAGAGLPPLELPEEEPTAEAERAELREQVRERLRMLHEPFLMLANAQIEMDQVEHLVREAREAFAADELLNAGKSANHASDLIWQLMQIHRADLQPAKEDENAGEPQPRKTPDATEGGRQR
jgi:hypothetical protein